MKFTYRQTRNSKGSPCYISYIIPPLSSRGNIERRCVLCYEDEDGKHSVEIPLADLLNTNKYVGVPKELREQARKAKNAAIERQERLDRLLARGEDPRDTGEFHERYIEDEEEEARTMRKYSVDPFAGMDWQEKLLTAPFQSGKGLKFEKRNVLAGALRVRAVADGINAPLIRIGNRCFPSLFMLALACTLDGVEDTISVPAEMMKDRDAFIAALNRKNWSPEFAWQKLNATKKKPDSVAANLVRKAVEIYYDRIPEDEFRGYDVRLKFDLKINHLSEHHPRWFQTLVHRLTEYVTAEMKKRIAPPTMAEEAQGKINAAIVNTAKGVA